MPELGKNQTPAGRPKRTGAKMPSGHRIMKSRDRNIIPDLEIDNIPYKGNVVLRANQ
jgi:hypothetical protein